MGSKIWDEIAYSFLNVNRSTVDVWEWINKFIAHFELDIIIHPCWDWSKSISVKWVPGNTRDREFAIDHKTNSIYDMIAFVQKWHGYIQYNKGVNLYYALTLHNAFAVFAFSKYCPWWRCCKSTWNNPDGDLKPIVVWGTPTRSLYLCHLYIHEILAAKIYHTLHYGYAIACVR